MNTTTASKLPFKTKFRDALDQKQFGVTDFTRHLGYQEPSKEFDAARRSVHRHLSGEAVPRREVRRRYEVVLGLAMGDMEPDDEEADRMSLDEFLRRRTRQILAEETARLFHSTQSNAPEAHLSASTSGASTEGAYRNGGSND